MGSAIASEASKPVDTSLNKRASSLLGPNHFVHRLGRSPALNSRLDQKLSGHKITRAVHPHPAISHAIRILKQPFFSRDRPRFLITTTQRPPNSILILPLLPVRHSTG